MTDTPPAVTDAMVARLVEALGPAGVMEQGFSDSCAVPLAAVTDRRTAAR
jgi:hypothetical protein